MRNYAVLLLTAMSLLSVTSFAETHPPGWTCPLKNLKKSQRRGPDGTAFIPGKTSISGKTVKNAGKSDAANAVFIQR